MVEVRSLTPVPLREVWANEALHFTPWLAEHPRHLSEVLGMDLELVGAEVPVGTFSADLAFVDGATGSKVVVENLLNATDHDHLGKLLTYAAGLDASYGVLVAKRFRPEHRSALTWLNRISKEGSGFFGIEVSAVRIGDSPPAVMLDVVVEPDDWARQVQMATSDGLSGMKAVYARWWAQFLPEFHNAHPGWSSASKPPAQSWINFPSGRSAIRYGLAFACPHVEYGLRVELYMDDGAATFPSLEAHRGVVDAELGPGVRWEELPDARASRVALYLEPVDPNNEDEWPRLRSWAIEQLGRFRQVFDPILAELHSGPALGEI